MAINHVSWTCGLRKVNDVACGRRQQVHDTGVSDYSSSSAESGGVTVL